MTISENEFEEYLQSIGGLYGHFTDRPPLVHNFCSCDDGWLGLIKNLIEELIEAGWDRHINDVKQKFGSLRFYVETGGKEIYDIIRKYEKLSEETCEVCGEKGEMREIHKWYYTLCEKDYQKRKEE